MKVTVDYLGYIKGVLGVKQPEVVVLKDNAQVRDLLAALAEKHGAPFKKAVYEPNSSDLKPTYIMSINGLLLNQLKELDTNLKDGDQVVLLPIVTGG
ncbi:MAG: MoaD family protein [Candidatus Bathyarchaeota archaeon]|nr:MoaD family protein [Candidatus Bathyarchaeota archaeon]